MRAGMGRALILVACLAASGGAAHSETTSASEDPWNAIRFLTGEWAGESEGEPGKGSVKQAGGRARPTKWIHRTSSSRRRDCPGRWTLRSLYSKARLKRVAKQ